MSKIDSFNLRPGTRVANYKIIENIGRGWEGEVYKVLEIPTEAVRALKLFRTDELPSIRHLIHVAWFYEQVRPTKHFPVYYHYGQWFLDDDNGCWFLVFEFVDGKSFKKLLKDDTFSKEQAFFLMANALAYIHQYGYAVGDFTTLENVYVTSENHVIFVDCDPGKPDRPNTNYRSDCQELSSVAERIFGTSKPPDVSDLLEGIGNTRRFTSTTLDGILKRLTRG